MSILLFWLERGGRQGSSTLTSPTDHQKLNVIQKWAFYILAGEGWWKGLEPIDQPSRSSEVECNPKRSILFFWVERGGRWGWSPSTIPANHQKLNVIQKWAFYFFDWREVADGVRVHWPAWPIIRSWTSSKNQHFIFVAGEGWVMGFKSVEQPGRSSKVERNPKMSILFFWLERGGR